MRPQPISIYDTTLRDGSQGEGVSFSVADKLHILHALDDLGIHYVEGGWPGSNPKDVEFFTEAARLPLRQARVAAFGSTRHAKHTPGKDPNLRKLVESRAPVVTIFGKTWDLHVTDALRVPLETNLQMIESSVRYLVGKVETVYYDAEHFFDGYKANRAYAMQTLRAAVDGGAEILYLCDTNGGTLPHEVRDIIVTLRQEMPGVELGIHTHNDAGMAVANTVEAVAAGAHHVQGTMNGLGERTGNADLALVIANLELKMGCRAIGTGNLRKLTETSRYIYEIANLTPPSNQPFVGRSAFAHKGGIHVSAVARNRKTYEHVEPESVGNERRILVSELSGRSNIAASVQSDLLDNPERMKDVLNLVMQKEKEGYAFEAANASFEILVRDCVGRRPQRFSLLSWRVISEERVVHDVPSASGNRKGRTVDGHLVRVSEAAVRVCVHPETGPRKQDTAADAAADAATDAVPVYHTVAEGEHGPVDALYKAIHKALVEPFPAIADLRLTDYKVHIVNAQAAAEARVRVVIQWAHRQAEWGTVGVSENILEASCRAILDSVEYLLLKPAVDAPRAQGKRTTRKDAPRVEGKRTTRKKKG